MFMFFNLHPLSLNTMPDSRFSTTSLLADGVGEAAQIYHKSFRY